MPVTVMSIFDYTQCASEKSREISDSLSLIDSRWNISEFGLKEIAEINR